jgi:hypothetical protein
MSKKAFEKIKAGLEDALADLRGEPGRVVKVTTIVPVDVKRVRKKTGLSQPNSPAPSASRRQPIASGNRGSGAERSGAHAAPCDRSSSQDGAEGRQAGAARPEADCLTQASQLLI